MRLSRDPFDEAAARAVAWLTAWDSQGHHRTGTSGDVAGALWLAHEAAGLGVDVTTEVFQLSRLDPVACHLELDGERIPAVPAFDAPATGADGVAGTLTLSDHDEAILVALLSPRSVYTGEYDRLRRDTAHRALVIVCTGARSGMGLLNAERFRNPYGAPTIHVSSEASETALAGATRAASARVVAESRYVPAIARNVVVALRGSRRSSPPVVVMTPRSSWWQSTAERGGGLVCWLESLRALIAAPPACDVIFTANSGHELGHLGLDDFMVRRPGWERPISEGGATWIHFGANIGAADGELSLQSASDDLRQLAEAELVRAGQAPDVVALKTLVPSGETRDIHRAGGRYVTLVGSNVWFHLPQDRWPHAVDTDAVTRIASAAAALVVKLTR
ncbi:MAG: hypothetical protein WA633_22935 [Stellaceae bacterium]